MAWIGPAIQIGGALLSGAMGNSASDSSESAIKNATQAATIASSNAARAAIGLQRPAIDTGYNAMNKLASIYGLPQQPGVDYNMIDRSLGYAASDLRPINETYGSMGTVYVDPAGNGYIIAKSGANAGQAVPIPAKYPQYAQPGVQPTQGIAQPTNAMQTQPVTGGNSMATQYVNPATSTTPGLVPTPQGGVQQQLTNTAATLPAGAVAHSDVPGGYLAPTKEQYSKYGAVWVDQTGQGYIIARSGGNKGQVVKIPQTYPQYAFQQQPTYQIPPNEGPAQPVPDVVAGKSPDYGTGITNPDGSPMTPGVQAAVGGSDNPFLDLLNSPPIQFVRQQGEAGINRMAAARGMTGSGARGKALAQYNTNLAATNYQGLVLNPLMTMAGYAAPAASNVGNTVVNAGTTTGNALMNQGAVNASGYQQSNIYNQNALGTITGTLADYFNQKYGGSNKVSPYVPSLANGGINP